MSTQVVFVQRIDWNRAPLLAQSDYLRRYEKKSLKSEEILPRCKIVDVKLGLEYYHISRSLSSTLQSLCSKKKSSCHRKGSALPSLLRKRHERM